MINIAVISIGKHARTNMLPAIKSSRSMNLIGIYTRDNGTRRNVANEYNVSNYESFTQLLLSDEVDAVYISSPTGAHYDQVVACIENGKQVLVEKTAFSSLDQTRSVLDLARKHKVVLMEAFMYQYHEQFKMLNRLVKSNKYGSIKKIECRFGFPHLPIGDIRYNHDLAGGALNDAGAYTLSAARKLLSEPQEVKWGYTNQPKEFEVDTSGLAVLKDSNDSLAVCSWEFGGSYVNDIRIWTEQVHIFADRAFSKQPDFDSTIDCFANGKIIESIKSGKDNHFVNMLEKFAENILSDECELGYRDIYQQAMQLESIRRCCS